MNENWKRWIFASMSKHFSAGKGDIAAFHVEGFPRNLEQCTERGEFRISGLDIDEKTSNEFQVSFAVNVLITVPITPENSHRIHTLTGRFANLFGAVAIQKLGDDNSQIGCASPVGKVNIVDFGQLTPDLKVLQSTVEGLFRLDLIGD